jgi:hypothetical protein
MAQGPLEIVSPVLSPACCRQMKSVVRAGCTVSNIVGIATAYPIDLQDSIASILNSEIANMTLVWDLEYCGDAKPGSTRNCVVISMNQGFLIIPGSGWYATSLWLQGTHMFNNTRWHSWEGFVARDRSAAEQLASVGEVWTLSSDAPQVFSNVVGLRKFEYPFGPTPLEALQPGGQRFAAAPFPTEADAAFQQLVEVRRPRLQRRQSWGALSTQRISHGEDVLSSAGLLATRNHCLRRF